MSVRVTQTPIEAGASVTSANVRMTQYVVEVMFPTSTGSALVANPASLSFTATAGGGNPPSQAVLVSSGFGGALAVTVATDQQWLSASPGVSNTPFTLTVSVDISGLAVSVYTANITLTSNCATTIVPVTLTLSSGGGGGGEGGGGTILFLDAFNLKVIPVNTI